MPTPIPIPLETGRLILFGGSFDPPHRAHLFFARFLLDRLDDASLVMVPAARSPHKQAGPVATAEHRVEMLRLGLHDVGLGIHEVEEAKPIRAGVWTDEIDRAAAGEPSYWIDTLRRTRSLLPQSVRLGFVIGSDQVAAFHRWREPHAILRLASPIVLVRGDDSFPDGSIVRQGEAERVAGMLQPDDEWTASERAQFAAGVQIGQPTMTIASTRIRQQLQTDPNAPVLEEWLTESVLRFIRREGLYRGSAP